jgi:adenosylcobalamin-dependent ribonucleoside-triphosphate reductase
LQFLKDSFIDKYPEFPEHMSNVGMFVYYRTYSRFIPELGRRETWRETARRAVEYNIGLAYKHIKRMGNKPNTNELRIEAQELFDSIFHLKQFLSGRTFWVGGAPGGVAEKYPLANFNCSFVTIQRWDDLGDLMYALMCGTGVGFKSTPEMTNALPTIRTNVEILHSDFSPVPKAARYEETHLRDMGNGYAKIYFGDSKEGWSEGLKLYLQILHDPYYTHIHTIKFSYNSIRPKGEPLKTFGGTASGYEPLKEIMQGIDDVLKNKIDPYLAPIEVDERGFGQVRPIHILTIGNLCGAGVVCGGVRRTAEIWLSSVEDHESLFAKYAINGLWSEEAFQRHEDIRRQCDALGIQVPAWWDEIGTRNYDPNVNGDNPFNFGRPLHHRRMSNNSVAFTEKPSRELLHLLFSLMQMEGEPGFVNLEAAARRRLRGLGIMDPSRDLLEHTMITLGLNPCAEILLDSGTPETGGGGGVCNLTTINFMMFVRKDLNGGYYLDMTGILEAQRRSARAGLRMTLATLELPSWDKLQQRDRLLGTSFTGEKDAKSLLGWPESSWDELMSALGQASIKEAEKLAREYRVSVPLLVNTVKPEGTLSQVASSLVLKSPVSSGLHYAEAPFFIRRVRINAADPLAKAVKDLPGWTVNPEVGTEGATFTEQMQNARTLVIDFPVASGAKRTLADVSAIEQLDGYFKINSIYTSHNSSNTIRVRPEEWEDVEEMIYQRWDEFVAVSFLAFDGGTYQLAPYEAISEDKYNEIVASMQPFDPALISKYERDLDTFMKAQEEVDAMNCEGGACAIR